MKRYLQTKIFVVLFFLPAIALTDYTSSVHTSGNDKIYFGFCNSCVPRGGGVPNGPGLKICRKRGDLGGTAIVGRRMDTGTLLILGGAGNDRIEAVNGSAAGVERGGCTFNQFNLLTYTAIEVHGQAGNDVLIGANVTGSTTQSLFGGPGNDYLAGHRGDDFLVGGGGNDFMEGGGGDDQLRGYSGNDFLSGGAGNDYLRGGRDDDILIGGDGPGDVVNGDEGSNIFRCRYLTDPPNRYIEHIEDTPDEHCNDPTPPPGVTTPVNVKTQKGDPYKHWVHLSYGNHGKIHHHLTTSNTNLLLQDRAGGASILLQSGGDIPVVGKFDSSSNRTVDDIAMFRSATGGWFFSHNKSGRDNDSMGPWGISGDRPIAGDFDRDGKSDDIAVFRPSTQMWYIDVNHNGRTDHKYGPWGNPGDMPVAGDFNDDGYVDDIAVFRPANRRWYFDDYNRDEPNNGRGNTNDVIGPWGNPGDIPIAGDFDGNGLVNDIGVFRPLNRKWYFDYFANGKDEDTGRSGTDDNIGPWGVSGDYPVVGDFNNDGKQNDLAVFRPSTRKWYFDFNRDATTNDDMSEWGHPGEPRAVTHKQYGSSCGPASLNIVMEHLKLVDRNRNVSLPQNLDGSPANPMVSLGYQFSMEHIMYLCYENYRRLGDYPQGTAITDFIDINGNLDVSDGGRSGIWRGTFVGNWYEIDYPNISFHPLPPAVRQDRVDRWLETKACGTHESGDVSRGLPAIANVINKEHSRIEDAYPIGTDHGIGKTFKSPKHIQDVIKGFVDNGIPIVIGFTRVMGSHFNAIIGYWHRSDGFWIYTADPLDGWGRAFHELRMRWRKIKLDENVLPGGVGHFSGMVLFGHGKSCRDRTWAFQLDRKYFDEEVVDSKDLLCGYL